jgi:hypothetical protein
LVEKGIPSNEIPYGFFLPLINRWLSLPQPFLFDELAEDSYKPTSYFSIEKFIY